MFGEQTTTFEKNAQKIVKHWAFLCAFEATPENCLAAIKRKCIGSNCDILLSHDVFRGALLLECAMMTMVRSKKLERSRSDRKVTGVCGGIADYFGVSSTLVRILLLGAFFFTGGTVLAFYFLLSLIIPVEPRPERARVSVGEVRLREVVSAARGKVSPPVLSKVNSVYESAEALLPKLNGADAKRDPELATLKEATFTYFPDTLENYLMLPQTYAQTHRLGGGRTPEQKLLDGPQPARDLPGARGRRLVREHHLPLVGAPAGPRGAFRGRPHARGAAQARGDRA